MHGRDCLGSLELARTLPEQLAKVNQAYCVAKSLDTATSTLHHKVNTSTNYRSNRSSATFAGGVVSDGGRDARAVPTRNSIRERLAMSQFFRQPESIEISYEPARWLCSKYKSRVSK
jgi:hypothetical protein